MEGTAVDQTASLARRSGRRAEIRTGTEAPAASGRRILLLSFLLIGALSTLWALASPLMSVPDEPAHTIKAAAVARGDLLGVPGAGQGDAATVTVPAYIAAMDAQTCYAFQPAVTADCAPPVGEDTTPVTATTTAGNYNPLYYFVAGLPTLFAAGAPAVYGMRIISALLCSAFLAMTFAATAKFPKPGWPFAAAAVGLTPMVLFLNGAVNPNALEIGAAASFFLNLCAVFQAGDRLAGARANIVFVGISGAVLANTRPLSLLWIALAAVAALLIYGFKPLLAVLRNWLGLAMTLLIGAGCAAALWWLVTADSLRSLTGTPTGLTPGDAFLAMLENGLDYGTGWTGRMGWLDTNLPNGIHFLWYVMMGAVLLAGLSARPLRARLAPVVLALSLMVVPAVLQAQVIAELGWIWQGRYVLALVLVTLLCCGTVMRNSALPSGPQARTVARLLIGLTVFAHLYAFVFSLRRYVAGLTGVPEWELMFMGPAWQPPVPWQALAAVYLALLVVGGTALYRLLYAASLPGAAMAEQPAVQR